MKGSTTIRTRFELQFRAKAILRFVALGVAALLLGVVQSCSDDGSADPDPEPTDAPEESTTTSEEGDSTTTTVADTTPDTAANTATSTPPVGVDQLPPVGVGEEVDFGDGVTVTVRETESVDFEARAPGETSGPAIVVTFEVRNTSGEPFELSVLAPTATHGDGVPAVPVRSELTRDLAGELAPGDSAEGVYLFRVPEQGAELLVEMQSGTASRIPRFRL